MKNVKKLNWALPNVTSKIRTKSIQPMVYALNNCFCRQKSRNEFHPKYGFCWRIIFYYHYLTHSSALPAAVMKPVLLSPNSPICDWKMSFFRNLSTNLQWLLVFLYSNSYIRAYFWSSYLSHITRSTCNSKVVLLVK